MGLTEYRNSTAELERTEDLRRLVRKMSNRQQFALDIGARDGYFSTLLADYFREVTALDLETPVISDARVKCIKGDVTNLDFPDNSFDLVFCAEVLEHIPPASLKNACSELSRVSGGFLIIGVPFKQDIRVGRTTCASCGRKNPPWGHVNVFDEEVLKSLFPNFDVAEKSFVGSINSKSNSFSVFLMDLAGNPYGTYEQEEACVHCDSELKAPKDTKLWHKVCTKIAFGLQSLQITFGQSRAKWIHLLLKAKEN